MSASRRWALAGLLLVGAARLAVPAAPALYEGIVIQQPYRYCNPPANLAGSNQQPLPGTHDMPAAGDGNQLGSPTTGDNQVLTFFAKGSLKAPGAQTYHVDIKPNCSPPAPPAGNKEVGNAYDISVIGQPGGIPVTFVQPAQVLLRTPPVRYSSIQLYYDGSWHSTTWGQQGDTANITINHAGTLQTFDDGRRNPPGKANPSGSGVATLIEAILVAAALGIVVAAIIVQQRRGREAAKGRKPSPYGPKGKAQRRGSK